MYVCICNAVTDETIRQEVNNGASDVKTLVQKLNVGNGCAKCVRALREMINQTLAEMQATQEIGAAENTSSLACKAA